MKKADWFPMGLAAAALALAGCREENATKGPGRELLVNRRRLSKQRMLERHWWSWWRNRARTCRISNSCG